MDSRFVVPVLVSTALHALVFLFGNGSRVPLPSPVNPAPINRALPRPISIDREEPVSVDTAETEERSERHGTPEVPLTGPEPEAPPVIGPLDFVVGPTPLPIDGRVVDYVPALPFGTPNADDSGSPGPGVVGSGWLDHTPRTRSQSRPEYPIEARQLGLSAEVTLEFVVDESGRVLHPRVVRSTDSRFDANALRAVERWRFEPGLKDGRVVAFRMVVPIVFSVSDD